MDKLKELVKMMPCQFSFRLYYWGDLTVELMIYELTDPLGGETTRVFYSDEVSSEEAIDSAIEYMKGRLNE